jgi:hypothetical protein
MRPLSIPLPKPNKIINADAISYVTQNLYEIGDLRANEAEAEAVIHFIGGETLVLAGIEAVAFVFEYFWDKPLTEADDESLQRSQPSR